MAILFLVSCNIKEKHSNSQQIAKTDTLQKTPPNYDTLPNGQRLLDNLDSGLLLYYKEVVGSDTLKGGYITCYGIDDSMRYFYLRKGNTLHLLNKSTKYQSPWSLRTLGKDFNTFFITTIDNGNGTPATYQVFDKKTGKNILADKVEAWDFNFLYDTLFLLYDNHTVHLIDNYIDRKDADSIFLYNMRLGKRQGFKLPKENPDNIFSYGLKKLTRNSLTISCIEHYTQKEKLLNYRR